MKTYHSLIRLLQDIETRLKKEIRNEYKSDKSWDAPCIRGASIKSIKIVDYRNGFDENRKVLQINVVRKDDGTHAFIKCRSKYKNRKPFEYKMPAPHVDVEYKNGPYERRITGAFAVNELRLPPMVKALTAWIKEELA